MRNILLTISYDGTDFSGWQKQEKKQEDPRPNPTSNPAESVINSRAEKEDPPPRISSSAGKSAFIMPRDSSSNPAPPRAITCRVKEVRTVQGELEKALAKLHKQPVVLRVSGRTDSGVHAKAQQANFFSPTASIPAQNYIRALNSLLPPDIRITQACQVPADFDARKSATSRTYRYYLLPGTPSAFDMRYTWPVKTDLDIDRLNRACSCLKGELDFTTFCSSADKSLSKCRYIESAFFFKENGKIVFQIEGNAFLWKMIRSIVGTLVFFEKSRSPLTRFKEALEAKDRKKAGPTAPPQGLFLWSVSYTGTRRHP